MTIQIKKRGQTDYVYDMTKVGGKMQATYLGKVGDPKTDERVKQFAESDAERRKKEKDKKRTVLTNSDDDIESGKTPINTPPKENGNVGISWGTRISLDSSPKAEKFHAPKRNEYRPDEHPITPVKQKAMFGTKDSQIESVVS